MSELFLEIECVQEKKYSENAYGDYFLSRRISEDDRTLAVLSDGMGSGIKASVLSTMTAHMAIKFIGSDNDIIRSMQTMLDALPICKVRNISYATFTVIDYREGEGIRVIEMDNPQLLFFRNHELMPIKRRKLTSPNWKNRAIYLSEFDIQADDRLIFVSDGVVQAGVGTDQYPMGWGEHGFRAYVYEALERHPSINALALANGIVSAAISRERGKRAYDDITCAVMHFHEPRKLMLVSGPPASKDDDEKFSKDFYCFDGKKIICGGTTCNIIQRIMGVKAETERGRGDSDLPPCAYMPGVDLVTEGLVTLSRVAAMLENEEDASHVMNAAGRLVRLLLHNDRIYFVVGMGINGAYISGECPPDLLPRRNIISRIARVLEEKYRKKVSISYC